MIFDNHAHLQLSGKNVEAARVFEKEGGTHLNVCTVPVSEFNILNYEKTFNETIKIVRDINSKTGVKAYATVGPYPIDFLDAVNRGMSSEKAWSIMKEGVDIAVKLVEQQKAIAIGEVGRPHFPVSQEIWQQYDSHILYIFERAKDIDCAVVMHTEYTDQTMKDIAEIADRAGLKREKIVKHYAPPIIKEDENYGIFPSVIASRKNVRAAFLKGTRFFLETDYVDDLKKPNFVLAIDTVPKRVKSAINEGLIDMEQLTDATMKNIHKVYNLDL